MDRTADFVKAGSGVLVYLKTTGRLFWHADGAGGTGGVEIAVLRGTPALTEADFVVVA